MYETLIGVFAGFIGIGLGGGIQALQAKAARKVEAAGVLSALVAEVEALTRLIHHRGFIPGLIAMRDGAAAMVAAGQGEAPVDWLVIPIRHNYIATYDALVEKIGLLEPYYADRITRYYTYAKAAMENYDPDSPFQTSITAAVALTALNNDLMILHTVTVLGNEIAVFRNVTAPTGAGESLQPDVPGWATPAVAGAQEGIEPAP